MSPDMVQREHDRIEEDKAPSIFLSLSDGETAIFRILPARPGEGSVFHSFWKHTYTDPITQQFIPFPCPRRNPPGDVACPVCDQSMQLMARGRSSKVDNDIGYAMSAKRRVVVNVYVYSITAGTKERVVDEVLVWEFSSGSKGKSMHEELLDIAANQRAGGDYAHPLTGFPFMLSRTGAQKNDTSYKLTPLYKESGPLIQGGSEAEILAVLERMHDLNSVVAPPSAEDLRQILSGSVGGASRQAPVAVPSRTGRASLPAPSRPTQGPARPSRTAASYMDQPPAPARPAERVPVEVVPRGQEPPGMGRGAQDDDIPDFDNDDDIPF